MSDYSLLADDSTGFYLCDEMKESGFELRPRCDDSCVWEWDSPSALKNAVTGGVVIVEPINEPSDPIDAVVTDSGFGPGASLRVPPKYRLVNDSHKLTGLGDQPLFSVHEAPARLPSAYLAELEMQGWTVVENLMSPEMVSNLIANVEIVRKNAAVKEAQVRAAQDGRPYRSNDNVIRPRMFMDKGDSFLTMTPVMAQALMHPVSLWLIESYLGVNSIHYCQCPGVSILRDRKSVV